MTSKFNSHYRSRSQWLQLLNPTARRRIWDGVQERQQLEKSMHPPVPSDPDLGFQVKVLKTLQGAPCLLGSGSVKQHHPNDFKDGRLLPESQGQTESGLDCRVHATFAGQRCVLNEITLDRRAAPLLQGPLSRHHGTWSGSRKTRPIPWKNVFKNRGICNQDVSCNRSIQIILVRIQEMFPIEIGQVFPQPLYVTVKARF